MIAEYMEHALQFERMAADAADPTLKESLTNQARAYHKLAEERTERLHLLRAPKARTVGQAPSCPRCGQPMKLTRTTPHPHYKNLSEEVFECEACGEEDKRTMRHS
jgi:predicted RNA-binding Zn-ribbon protein involved in translation (DUF1610 family)